MLNSNDNKNNSASFSKNASLILGVDIGTSGVRSCLVSVKSGERGGEQTRSETVLAECSVNLPLPNKCPKSGASVQSPHLWTVAFEALFKQLVRLPKFTEIEHIVADATSSTVLLCDANGWPLTDALMYDDQQAKQPAETINQRLTEYDESVQNTAATGSSSTLAKVLYLFEMLKQNQGELRSIKQPVQICHQIDWFNGWLTGQFGLTDENNALKLGYDSVNGEWPNWVKSCLQSSGTPLSQTLGPLKPAGLLTLPAELNLCLPRVFKPGTVLSHISSEFARRWQLNPKIKVHAGTTDSIAGFLASGAQHTGDAVTSLGSTIAVKLISEQPIFNAEYGIYSHRLGSDWLVGGASNAGGAVLLAHFSLDEIKQHITWLTKAENRSYWQYQANPRYYPLIKNGERFPVSDPNLEPKMPLPPRLNRANSLDNRLSNRLYFVGLVQGLANIERLGYQRLLALGATPVKRIFSVGGGTQNPIWQQLRSEYLQRPLNTPDSLSAAFGVTRLVSTVYQA